MKRLTRSALLSLVVALGAATAVHAEDEWCSADPAVPIKTPAGNTVVVHVTNYALGQRHLPALQQAKISYSVTAAPGGSATDVVMRVTIPGDSYDPSFRTRSVVSSGANASGTIYASAEGVSGVTTELRFRLNVA